LILKYLKFYHKFKLGCCIMLEHWFNLFECLSEFKFKFGFIWVKFV